mgnify:CR=1|tara:strand:+ start:105 stop:350 length:246 start_codon:yes stop_codon:yes gene_type:complete
MPSEQLKFNIMSNHTEKTIKEIQTKLKLTEAEQLKISQFLVHHHKTLREDNQIGRLHLTDKAEVTRMISSVIHAMAETIWE